MSIVLDPRARVLDGGRTLLGGDPWRVMRLTEQGAAVLRRLLAGEAKSGDAVALGPQPSEAVGGAARALGPQPSESESGAAGALARRLIDAGLAHPRPTRARTGAVTAIIPVRDRAAELDRCLRAVLAADAPGRVLVVDDGSRDPRAVGAVCARHRCELIRRERPGGPAAARNLALGTVGSGLVALLDSDCVPEPGWLSLLCGMLAADPGLGAVAPRVRPLGAGTSPSDRCGELYSGSGRRSFPALARASCAGPQAGALARFAAVRSPLDLGPWPSLVRPGGRVAYVPTAALLVRREALGPTPAGLVRREARGPTPAGPVRRKALGPTPAPLVRPEALGVAAEPFDPGLRHGEDVDLVWRMIDRGWSVRYEPEAVVRHHEPQRLWPWLARRFRYGTSAGPLAHRHPERLAPVALQPRSVAVLAAATLAAGVPAIGVPTAGVPAAGVPATGMPATGVPAAVAAVALHVGLVVRSLSRHGVPPRAAAALALRGLGESGAALGRAATMLAAGPLVVGGLRRRRTRRAALALLLAAPIRDIVRLRPALDPVRFTALSIADDVAYGHGVWAGAVAARTWRPLRPRIVR